jgi:hypothetical protein
MASVASPDADPIFALIEAHRAAAKLLDDVTAEQSRREQVLVEEGLGLTPFVTLTGVGGRPFIVYDHKQVDAYGSSLSEPLKARAHGAMDAAIDRHNAVYGDVEQLVNVATDREAAALQDFVWSVPTSMAGIRAMLAYSTEIMTAPSISTLTTLGPSSHQSRMPCWPYTRLPDLAVALKPAGSPRRVFLKVLRLTP